MNGCDHYPDDGRWPVAGDRATCGNCRRSITFAHGLNHDHWRASGPFGGPLPKSRRCTSRNPVVGYLGCAMLRNHLGTCRGGGYVWYRGRGHSRPSLVSRPSWGQR